MNAINTIAKSIKTLFSNNHGLGSLAAKDEKIDIRFGI